MQPVPFVEQGAGFGSGRCQVCRHQRVVDRLDDQKRPGPRRQDMERAEEEGREPGLPPGDGAKQKAKQSQARLHGEAVLVGRFPLGKQVAVVQLEPRRLLGEIDVESRAGEEGRNDECEMSYKHVSCALVVISVAGAGDRRRHSARTPRRRGVKGKTGQRSASFFSTAPRLV